MPHDLGRLLSSWLWESYHLLVRVPVVKPNDDARGRGRMDRAARSQPRRVVDRRLLAGHRGRVASVKSWRSKFDRMVDGVAMKTGWVEHTVLGLDNFHRWYWMPARHGCWGRGRS